MKHKSLVFCSMVVLLAPLVSNGQDIGGLFVGADIFLDGHQYPAGTSIYEMDDAGIGIGFLLPIGFPKVDTHYKVRAVVRSGSDITTGEVQHYISATNECLIGKRFLLRASEWDVLPQFGVGAIIEDIYATWGHGLNYYVVFIDLAVTLNRHFKSASAGVMLNLENAVYTQYVDSDTDTRMGVSLILWL